jgi:uncharacterized Zn finger protein
MSWRYHDWEYYTPSKPIKVEGGIKIKRARGDIGDTWWSKRWVSVLESFGWSNRLQRGRQYARGGQVLEFTLNPGKISAKVQGSVSKPYTISIELKPFTATLWKKIIKQMSQKAVFAAKLLVGEMPSNIEEIFNTVGVPLFPESSKDLKTNCSCPDSANPCKHIAATYYILAEEFDRDPFMLFKLRGKSKEDLLDLLRKERTTPKEELTVSGDKLKVKKKSPKLKKEDNSISITDFWEGKNLDSFEINISHPETQASIIKRLGKPPFWDVKDDFIASMNTFYALISKSAIKIAYNQRIENNNILKNEGSEKNLE